MEDDPLVLSAKKTVFPHAMLLTAAEAAAELAVTHESKRAELSMMAILSAAFGIEAYLNDLGAHLLQSWDDLECRLSPEGKLRLLLERLDRNEERGKGPFQSFGTVFRFRNQVVHAKPTALRYEYTSPGCEVISGENTTKWEALCRPEEASRLVADAKGMIARLHEAAARRESWWVHSKTVVEVPGRTEQFDPVMGQWHTTSERPERRLSDVRRERAAERYTYRVSWSESDEHFVGTCAQLPCLTYADPDRDRAYRGILKEAADEVADLVRRGEDVPEPSKP